MNCPSKVLVEHLNEIEKRMDEAMQKIKDHKMYIGLVRENKVNTEADPSFRKHLKEIEKFLVEPFIKDEAEIF